MKIFGNLVNQEDAFGNLPIHYAAFYWNQAYVEILLKAKTNINAMNQKKNTPLHLSSSGFNPNQDHTPKFEEFLISKGANIDAENNWGETPIMLLFESKTDAKFDPVTALMVFLKNNANLKKKNVYKETVLHYACRKGSTISALTLINKGMSLDEENIHGNTPFSLSIMNGHEDLCIFLI